MTTSSDIYAIVGAHRCVVDEITYQFNVAWIATEHVVESASPRVLLQVQVTTGEAGAPQPILEFRVLTPLQQPARIPLLLTDALHQHIGSERAGGGAQHPFGRRDESCAVSDARLSR